MTSSRARGAAALPTLYDGPAFVFEQVPASIPTFPAGRRIAGPAFTAALGGAPLRWRRGTDVLDSELLLWCAALGRSGSEETRSKLHVSVGSARSLLGGLVVACVGWVMAGPASGLQPTSDRLVSTATLTASNAGRAVEL